MKLLFGQTQRQLTRSVKVSTGSSAIWAGQTTDLLHTRSHNRISRARDSAPERAARKSSVLLKWIGFDCGSLGVLFSLFSRDFKFHHHHHHHHDQGYHDDQHHHRYRHPPDAEWSPWSRGDVPDRRPLDAALPCSKVIWRSSGRFSFRFSSLRSQIAWPSSA